MEIPAELYKEIIKRGAVLIGAFTGIDHKKFFVVAGESGEMAGYFFINSNINSFVQSNKSFMDLQMPIKRSCYPSFLTHDSFIDAHELRKAHKSTLAKQLTSGKIAYRGMLSADDLEQLLEGLRSSPVYKKVDKDTFFKP
ncbi:MAG: hypothetical protein LBF67_04500 [Prevotellaceae bacterium]|jgi:hypothetical protein|nr:hypothetical protein [Prevotellaceae bacterium]